MIGRKAKDPVCGMVVDKKNAISKTIAGKTYYFCSEECAKTYEVQQSDTSHHMHHHSGNQTHTHKGGAEHRHGCC